MATGSGIAVLTGLILGMDIVQAARLVGGLGGGFVVTLVLWGLGRWSSLELRRQIDDWIAGKGDDRFCILYDDWCGAYWVNFGWPEHIRLDMWLDAACLAVMAMSVFVCGALLKMRVGQGVGLAVGAVAGFVVGLLFRAIVVTLVRWSDTPTEMRAQLLHRMARNVIGSALFLCITAYASVAGKILCDPGPPVDKHGLIESPVSLLALRLTLTRNDRAPWNMTAFLDYCAERIFLRRVGGGYIFIHRLLQEYFASLYEEGPT